MTLDGLLGRVANGILLLRDDSDALRWEANLDMDHQESADAYVQAGNRTLTACSAGFQIIKSKVEKMVDTSPEAVAGDKPVRMIRVQQARLIEVSLVAHGAFSSATTLVAAELGELVAGPPT